MFCWSLESISTAFETLLPDVYCLTKEISKVWQSEGLNKDIASIYAKMPRIPIDIGIMEKAEFRGVIPVSYHWSDVGSWKSLADLTTGDADNNYFSTSGKAISAQNIKMYDAHSVCESCEHYYLPSCPEYREAIIKFAVEAELPKEPLYGCTSWQAYKNSSDYSMEGWGNYGV